jgi:uncharacterized protein (DUF1800 family)
MVNLQNHFQRRMGFGLRLPLSKGSIIPVEKTLAQSSALQPIAVISKPVIDSDAEMIAKVKKIFQKSKEESIQLNLVWCKQMTQPEVALREKLTFFWHDHFACRARIPWLAQQQNNSIRTHALGSFADLLMAVSKDPAMIQFLNNQQNKKASPNENFAREVMELFTLGRGHYTEEDVKEAARAFTGWGFDPRTGEFLFRPRVHDDGMKSFRGSKGNFTGEDIIEQLLNDRQTARFITEKVWAYFVSNEVRDEEIFRTLAEQFYQSNYTIQQLIQSIAVSDWFYEPRFVGNRIKSPIELMVGLQLQTQGTFVIPATATFLQRAMGQILFFPPNVGGWPQGREWIDSSSLTFRLSLPGILLRGDSTDFQSKDDGDINNLTNNFGQARFAFQVDWAKVAQQFTAKQSATTLQRIEDFLLAQPTTQANRVLIEKHTSTAANDLEFVQRAYIGYMSLPEYQLC